MKVTFEDVRLHRDAALRLFDVQRRQILSWVPDVEVMHVGSTAFESGLSRGDLDIQIRVAPDRYAVALAAIAPHYVVNPDGYTSDDAASFKDDDLDPPVGLILTAINGSGDALWCFRDALLARPDLAAEYSAIKARSQGGSLAAYRADKHLFVRRVMRTPEYARITHGLHWRYRPVRVETARAVVFDVQDGDAASLAAYYARNEARLAPWTSSRPTGWTTEAFWRQRITDQLTQKKAGAAVQLWWGLAGEASGEVAGVAHLSHIDAQGVGACALRFSVDGRQEGTGLAKEALTTVIRYAFEDVGLRRIRAAHAPTNVRCAHLLRRLGFQVEDPLPADGHGQDQVLTALVNLAAVAAD